MKRKPKQPKIEAYKYIAIHHPDDSGEADHLSNGRVIAWGSKDYVIGNVECFIINNKMYANAVKDSITIFKVGSPQAVSCAIVSTPRVTLDF